MRAATALACFGVSLICAVGPAHEATAEPQGSYFRFAWCDEDDPDRRREGWHFYCDDPPPEDRDEPEEQKLATRTPPARAEVVAENPEVPPTAVEKLAAITAEIEELRAEALLHPEDPAKVEAYQRAQAQVVARASAFSDTWRRNVWAQPDLDYTLRRPTNAIAGPIYHEERNAAEIAALKEISETHGVFFIFEGGETCKTCAAQAVILENIATRHGVTVVGVSRDGSTLPQFPDPLRGRDRLKAFDLLDKPVPALVLVEPKTGFVQPISFGAVSEEQILNRIFVTMRTDIGEAY